MPHGSKSDVEASESSEEEESEESDDVEDEDEEEDDEENEEDEDDEESDGEKEEEEETIVAKTHEGDNGREVPEMQKITVDLQMQSDVNMEPTIQPEPSNTLIEESDHTMEHFSLMGAESIEAEIEGMERQNIMRSENPDDALEKAVPHTLAIEASSLLSGIGVKSALSDEDENDYSNTCVTGAFRTPLQIAGSTPRTEKNCDGDGDENWEEDEDNEPFNCMVSKQPHEIGDEKHFTNDIKANDSLSHALAQSTNQDKADDNSNQENVNDITKPSDLNLLRYKEEPESSEDTWGSGSDHEKEGLEEGDTLDIKPVDLQFYERERIRAEDRTVIHDDDDDENLPVSMIVGSDDLGDTESHVRLPAEHAEDGEIVYLEEIPQTVIDDIDVSSHSDKDDKDEELGNLKVQEHVHHIIPG